MKANKRKKILITGGAGFIGSSLILSLQNTHDIVCFGRGKGFQTLKKHTNKHVVYIAGQVTDEKKLEKIISNVDTIIHLAGGGGNTTCLQDPVWALQTHIQGTRILTRLAVKHRIEKFIFASSYLVYGSVKKSAESTLPAPESMYASLKMIAEQIVQESGLDYTIVRLANVYGYTPTHTLQNAGAINNFIHAVLGKKSIHIQGTGTQTIDYVHIQDVVQAFTRIFESKKEKSIYNIGSGEVITIKKLAEIVQKMGNTLYKNKTPIVKNMKADTSTQKTTCMSIRKMHSQFTWKPIIDMKTGILELMLMNKSV